MTDLHIADEVDKLLRFISIQNERLERLDKVLESLTSTRTVEHLDLPKALRIIEMNRDENKRITWRHSDPKVLVFAYLRKAEADGLNIERTTEMQSTPTYRRVFQYVVYNIGPWKEIVEEYRKSP